MHMQLYTCKLLLVFFFIARLTFVIPMFIMNPLYSSSSMPVCTVSSNICISISVLFHFLLTIKNSSDGYLKRILLLN